MGKQGPCHHCGVTSTPLWRNGPPEKPVLCNACGSRWRTKGTLTNYTPLHARADIVDSVDFKISKVKSITIKTKGHKFQKRKHYDNVEVKGEAPKSDQNFRKVLEEDTSNRSSSGSAISYSESCVQFGSADASDFTGSAQSNVWDSLVPSKKRTCVSRPKPSSVEKLTKDLYFILHEQQSSNLSGSSEEELIFESETPLVSVEIGHGGVLIRHPNLVAREEESEASSLPIDNKVCSATSDPVHTESKETSLLNIGGDNIKKLAGKGAQEHMKRGKFPHDKLHILHSDSPLGSIDLRDVVSFEEFMIHLTHEEQQQLMKYLPYTDTAKLPESLKSMFGSPQFVDALYSFQQLLLEGIFDPSFPGAATEERRLLKRLAIGNLTKSKWVERYQLLKDQITIITAWLILIWAEKSAEPFPIPSSPKAKWNQRPYILPNIRTEIDSDLVYVYDARHKKAKDEKGVSIGTGFFACGNLAPPKRPRDGQNQNFPETKGTLKSPKMQKCGTMNLPSTRSHLNLSNMDLKESYDPKDMDNDGSCFSPRSLFAFTLDRSSIMLDSLQFTDESSDQDLLFDMPPNAPLPQAELLHFHPCKQKTPPDCSLAESEVTGNFPSLSLSSQLSNSSILYPHLVLP